MLFSKSEKLNEVIKYMDFTVIGKEKIPVDHQEPFILFANHGHIMDIFYLAASSPEEYATIMSNRVVYKPIPKRQQLIESYLYPLPLEATLGSYANISLEAAKNLLLNGVNLGIFPEGVLNDGKVIVRGRTGIVRTLFSVRSEGVKPLFIPAAIDVRTDDSNPDRYNFDSKDKIVVSILDPIDYEPFYNEFLGITDSVQENELFHNVMDVGMKAIADELHVPFTGDYGFFYPKPNIMFSDGSTVPLVEANNSDLLEKFSKDIKSRERDLIRSLKPRY